MSFPSTLQTTDRRASVAKARKLFAEVRTIERNTRMGRYQGRNSRSTENLLKAKVDGAGKAARDAGHSLEGKLWAEHRMAIRVSEARDAGQDRPELKARLKADRREIAETLERVEARAACIEWDKSATDAEYDAVNALCEKTTWMPGPQASIQECPVELLALITKAAA